MTISCSVAQKIENNTTSPLQINTNSNHIEVGANRTYEYLDLIRGKKVGIVANQTSIIKSTHLVDSLLSLNVTIKRVFSPEHGFRGDADAGEHIESSVDKKTGLPISSLYGKNRKPTSSQLADIEIMLFDIQDVGVRFYTYISTLHYVMEACAEHNIFLIVLDRPNPNGHYVDGPVLKKEFTSFVGMHPVPIVHGMTIGEYAQMINGEKWLKDSLHCNLKVIKCENYDHNRFYSLPVSPSPNLRSDEAIQLYPSLCLFEGTSVSVGRGTDGPFERYGHPEFPETGFSFTPTPGFGSKDPKYANTKCNGYNLKDNYDERPEEFDLTFLLNAKLLLKEKEFINQKSFFNKLAGNDVLIEQINKLKSEDEIRQSWEPELSEYKKMRKQYLLYK